MPDHKESKDVACNVNGVGSSQMYAHTCLHGGKKKKKNSLKTDKVFTVLIYLIYLVELCLNRTCFSDFKKKKKKKTFFILIYSKQRVYCRWQAFVIKHKERKEEQEVVFPYNRYLIHRKTELFCYTIGNLEKILQNRHVTQPRFMSKALAFFK